MSRLYVQGKETLPVTLFSTLSHLREKPIG